MKEVVECGARPLEGEHDCLLGLELVEEPGLPLDAETGLSVIDVLKFGGTSCVKPGISEGFQRAGFLTVVGPPTVNEDERLDCTDD